jgi:hypothetical protein
MVGDLALARFEDELGTQWPACLDRKPRAFRVISAFWRLIEQAAKAHRADLVLVDVGPNLGSINRAALIAASHVVIPLASDLYSLQGLRNLGPTLRRWRAEWADRRSRNPIPELSMPAGSMNPAGYVVLQHAVRLDRPVQAYERWMARIPEEYRSSVLEMPITGPKVKVADDPYCLSTLRQFRSLMPLAQEARKPMFSLTPADGAIGGHAKAVQDCFRDFESLSRAIARSCGIDLPRRGRER